VMTVSDCPYTRLSFSLRIATRRGGSLVLPVSSS
jgi:hypothetical protein